MLRGPQSALPAGFYELAPKPAEVNWTLFADATSFRSHPGSLQSSSALPSADFKGGNAALEKRGTLSYKH